MHCLLCHEKIPRLRYWRTKSEFCCDEHAATHRRQTLERLVGGGSPTGESVVDPEERLAALTQASTPPPASELFGAESEREAGAASELEAAHTATAEGAADEHVAADEEFAIEQNRHEPVDEEQQSEADEQETAWWQRETADQGTAPETAALEDENEMAAQSAGEGEITDPALVLEQEDSELVAEDFGSEVTGEDEDDPAYFESTSVQHDEPFPIEISPAASSRSEQPEPELPEPLEPSALADASSSDLLELLAMESSSGAVSDPEPLRTSDAGPIEAEAAGAEAAPHDQEAELQHQQPEPAAGPEISSVAALEPSVPQLEDLETADALADPESAANVEPAEQPLSAEAKEPVRKGAGKPKRSPLQPLKAWDPSRPRAAKKGKAGRAAGADSLNRLAGQLSDRDSKLRAFGPGSEARREGKSKLVCFLPVQGGNGSSTVSLHVAEAISHHLNKRVLLADFDFHSGTLAFRLGLKPEHTFVDVFKWEQPENGAWDKVVCPWKQLDVLVAPPSNTSIRPQSMDQLPEIFMSALRRYPYVIVDHPDAIYSSSRHILAMSDLVYLVCTPEITSLHLARRKVQQIRAMGVPGERLRLIVNRTGSWGSLGLEDVGKIAGVPVSWALMNDYAALRDAVWNGGLVQQGSGLAKQLRELGWSVMGVDAQVAEESAAPPDVVSSHA